MPESIRRTSTTDCHWPDGLDGRVVSYGTARDLLTDSRGGGTVLAEASVIAEIAYQDDRKITGISSTPHVPGLDLLVGVTAGPGFRRRMTEVASEDRRARTPLHLLLDD